MVLFFLFVIIHCIYIYSKIITQKFIYNNERPVLSLYVNQGSTIVRSLINTFHPFSLINKKLVGPIPEQLLFGKKTLYLESEVVVIHYQPDITFEDNILKGYNVYLYLSHLWYPDQGISLAYKFDNESYSLVHMLYNNKVIEKKLYGIYFDNNRNEGSISFGGIPSNAHLAYSNKGSCNANDKYSSWGCNLTSINFDNISYSLNAYGALNPGLYGIIYSKKIFNLFIDHIL